MAGGQGGGALRLAEQHAECAEVVDPTRGEADAQGHRVGRPRPEVRQLVLELRGGGGGYIILYHHIIYYTIHIIYYTMPIFFSTLYIILNHT